MKAILRAFLVASSLFFAASDPSIGQTSLTGLVVDRYGKPIQGVRYSVSGFSTPSGSQVLRSGDRSFHFTDQQGTFRIPGPGSDELLDLQFDEEGGSFVVTNGVATRVPPSAHAPTFLYRVKPADSPLRVVMTEGKVLKGRIVERLNDQLTPVASAEVELQMPQPDFWYQSKVRTDDKGGFQFRISKPPKERTWILYYAGKRTTIDYEKVMPQAVMLLEISVKLTSSAEPSAVGVPQSIAEDVPPGGRLEITDSPVAALLDIYAHVSGLELVRASDVKQLGSRVVILPERHGATWDTANFCRVIEEALLSQAGVVITRLDGTRASVTYNDALKVTASAADKAAWGEAVEGVSVRMRADKTRWPSNETPTFKLDMRNQGQREFYTAQSQETGRLEVDGVWYSWIGVINLESSQFPPGREYHDIPVSLGSNWNAIQEWRDKTQAPPPQIPLRLLPGKHTIRFAPEIRDITAKPKPQNNYVPSNPVEIETWGNLK